MTNRSSEREWREVRRKRIFPLGFGSGGTKGNLCGLAPQKTQRGINEWAECLLIVFEGPRGVVPQTWDNRKSTTAHRSFSCKAHLSGSLFT